MRMPQTIPPIRITTVMRLNMPAPETANWKMQRSR